MSMRRKEFVLLAREYLNFPAMKYCGEFNGIDQSGFDCSGFASFLLRRAEYPNFIPRHANEIFDLFGIFIHEQFACSGDLVFFCGSNGLYPNHIGIMISEDEYIHSPGKDGRVICIKRLERKCIETEAVSQIYFSNPIGFKRVTSGSGRYQEIFFQD